VYWLNRVIVKTWMSAPDRLMPDALMPKITNQQLRVMKRQSGADSVTTAVGSETGQSASDLGMPVVYGLLPVDKFGRQAALDPKRSYTDCL